jgi:hypothetical protein
MTAKRQERSPQLATSSPGAGPSTPTSRQHPSSSTIIPQSPGDPTRRRGRSPSPPDTYDRGLPRSHPTGRLFDPTAEPSSSRSPMAIASRSLPQSQSPPQQMEAMSDVSSVGGGGSPRKALQTRGAHPVRTRGPAQGAAALSIPAPRNPQIAQWQTSPRPCADETTL